MPERPRIFLLTKETNSTSYVDLLAIQISANAKGVSYLSFSIDPDPNALYTIAIGKLMFETELEVTAVWTLVLPHLTAGVYEDLNAGDPIRVMHRSKDAAVTVKTGVTLALNEVTRR